MSEYGPSAESIRSNDENVVLLSRFAFFNLQFEACIPLKFASQKLRSISRNRLDRELTLSSLAGYEASVKDYEGLRHGHDLASASSEIEDFFTGKPVHEIYLDGDNYKIKQTDKGVAVAIGVKDESRESYHEIIKRIGKIDPSLWPVGQSAEEGGDYVYAKFMAKSGHERDFAVLSLKKSIKDLAQRDSKFLSMSKPQLMTQYKLKRVKGGAV